MASSISSNDLVSVIISIAFQEIKHSFELKNKGCVFLEKTQESFKVYFKFPIKDIAGIYVCVSLKERDAILENFLHKKEVDSIFEIILFDIHGNFLVDPNYISYYGISPLKKGLLYVLESLESEN